MIKVSILAKQTLIIEAIDNFLDENQTYWSKSQNAKESELLCEFAGRICYMSFGTKQHRKTNQDYINNLIEQGHESVLEHATWTVLIENISRACSHQLVRHRVGWAFSQLSQQYHEETDALYIIPTEVKDNDEALRLWESTIKNIKEAYNGLISIIEKTDNKGLNARENVRAIRSASRSILPNAIETKIVATVNARALRHFFSIRGETPGDREMRALSCELYKTVSATAPNLFSDFRINDLDDGGEAISRI